MSSDLETVSLALRKQNIQEPRGRVLLTTPDVGIQLFKVYLVQIKGSP